MSAAQNHQADVVIAGGGIAGIVAALELLDSGQQILILDRDEKSRFGGLARDSFGAMFFVDTAIQRCSGFRDSPELALKDWHSYAQFSDTDYWPKQWAEYYVNSCTTEGYHWLKQQGVRFLPIPNWVERGTDRHPGNSVPRFHIVWGSGKGLIEPLIARLYSHKNAAKLKVLFRHQVTDIETQNGVVTGLRGVDESSGKEFVAQAENTIIASGGICGSIERIKENWFADWGEPPQLILNGSHRYAEGRLHDAAQKTGANVTHLDRNWLYPAGIRHPQPRHPNHGLSIIPCKSALWLDAQGRRFGPEPLVGGFDAREIVETICRQEHKYSWQVLNKRIAVRELSISGSEHNPALRDKKALKFIRGFLFGAEGLVEKMLSESEDFIVANSLDELADKMQKHSEEGAVFDTQAMKQAVRDYDKSVTDRSLPQDRQSELIDKLREYWPDRIRSCKLQAIDDARAYPLIAIREHILSRKSLGGIQTDLQSRVLSKQGEVLPNLYAVGEAAGYGGGGIHGHRSLEGTFLGGCVLSARLAGADILDRKVN